MRISNLLMLHIWFSLTLQQAAEAAEEAEKPKAVAKVVEEKIGFKKDIIKKVQQLVRLSEI